METELELTWKSKMGNRLNTMSAKIRKSLRDPMNLRGCNYPVPLEKLKSLAELNFSEEQVDEVKKAFEIYDKQHNGTISTNQLIKVMRSLGKNPTEDEIDVMIYDVDTDIDGNGFIKFLEFLEMIAYYRPEVEETLREALELFDDDGSGFINLQTFHNAMTTQGAQVSEEEFADIVSSIKVNEHGNIKIAEIINCFLSEPPS